MVLLAVQGIVLVPIYLHYIDARLYGAWLATGSIVAVLGMLDFGFFSVIVQKTATIAGGNDYRRLGELIGTSLVITFIIGLLPVLAASLLYTRVPAWINLEGPEARQIANAVLIAGATTSMMLLSYGFGALFLGLQRVGVLSIQFVLSSAIGIIATLVFLSIGWGVLSIPSGLLVQSFLLSFGHGVYLWWWIRGNLPPKSLKYRNLMFVDLFRPSIWVFVGRLSNTAATQSDNLIVAAMIDPRLTIILALTRKSSDIISTIASRISSAFMSSLAHLSGGGELNIVRSRQFMLIIMKISLIVGIFGLGGIFLLNEVFIRLWVGQEFYGGALLTGFICVSSFVIVLNSCLYNNIFARGEIRVAAKATMCEAFVRIPLSVGLCHYFGILGVVLAGIVAMLPTSLLIQMRCFLGIVDLAWGQAFLSALVLFLKASIPVVVGLLVRMLWSPTGLAELFLFIGCYSLFGGVFYCYVDMDVREVVTRGFGAMVARNRSALNSL
jgi:O-antigen/teichoic acid export membrane protein